jgi:2-keto-4-pentenoate hydratase
MSDITEAARLLVEARRTGKPLRELPESCKPASADEVNAIIDAVTGELNEHIGGWKIGFLYSRRQKPIICPLFEARLFESPARVPLAA